MRIISDFKDYYDGGMGFFSSEPLYLRKTVMHKQLQSSSSGPHFAHVPLASTDASYMELNEFCKKNTFDKGAVSMNGKLYPFLHINGVHYYTHSDKIPKFCAKFFEKESKRNDNMMAYHTKFNCPIFAFRNVKNAVEQWYGNEIHKSGKSNYYRSFYMFELNPNLKSYEFFRVKDAYSAFQEIEMWLSNQASPEKSIPSVSNNDMIEAKGFDLKHSFRNTK